MGNYRFRLSDMMPNAWFYKLKEMGRASRNQSISHPVKRGHAPRTAAPTAAKQFLPQEAPASKQAILPNRASYYFTRGPETEKLPNSPVNLKAADTHFPVDPPRKSKRRSRRKPAKSPTKLVTSSVSSGCSCSVWRSESMDEFPVATSPESPPYQSDGRTDDEDDDLRKPIMAGGFELDGIKSWSHSCACRLTSSATDIIIDVGRKSSLARKLEKFKEFDAAAELDLRPILTKPAKQEAEPVKLGDKDGTREKGSTHTEQSKSSPKRSPAGLHRLRMRASSPRFGGKRIQAHRARRSSGPTAAAAMRQRKGLPESFAVVKSSSDPQRDFRDSMVEMIVENNIRASKDLEDLLACYLTLNSNEYHDVIVKVFEQIWFDLTEVIRL